MQQEYKEKGERVDGVGPAFAALIYPVASMIAPSSHRGSKLALLGKNPSPELLRTVSPELNIKKSGPPVFIAHNGKDPVDSKLSVALAAALKKNGIDCDLHIFKGTAHGFGMGIPGQTKEQHPANVWPDLFQKFLSKKAKSTIIRT